MAMPKRLTLIGPDERSDHFHLPADADCYFWGEYTPYEHTDGKKWNYPATNQLISTFKKKMDRAGEFDCRCGGCRSCLARLPSPGDASVRRPACVRRGAS